MTEHKHYPPQCPHQWNQNAPFIPAWVQSIPPTPVCPPKNPPVSPNPVFPSNATLPICNPLEIKKAGSHTVLVTVSIPTESIFTLPSKALEIKTIKKHLKITQCRFFNCFPAVRGIPHDTPKLFLGGFVRKDIQYSEPFRQTATTVEGTIKDFVIDLPFTCVIDLGGIQAAISPALFSQQQEYKFYNPTSLPLGFSPREKLMLGDLNEYNVVSQQFLNKLPECELIYSQINEMDDVLDRVPLPGGPFEEGVFRTLQEKMIVLIQLQLTFPTKINPHHCQFPEPSSEDGPSKNEYCSNKPLLEITTKLLKCLHKGISK